MQSTEFDAMPAVRSPKAAPVARVIALGLRASLAIAGLALLFGYVDRFAEVVAGLWMVLLALKMDGGTRWTRKRLVDQCLSCGQAVIMPAGLAAQEFACTQPEQHRPATRKR